MSAYIGRTYTMTVSGTVSRRERCAIAFEYEICRYGMGNGHSPFLLFNFGARQTAERRGAESSATCFRGGCRAGALSDLRNVPTRNGTGARTAVRGAV